MTLNRHKPLPRSPFNPKKGRTRLVSRRRALRAKGKKGKASQKALGVFKRECARLGIERCEVRYEGCFGVPDTWAHGRRRRLLKEGELEAFAVAACAPCHFILDTTMSHAETAEEVTRIIGLRPERYLEAA
jgi:hypothetical protein